MRLSHQLKQEFSQPVKGQYAPQYFKNIGYRETLGAPVAQSRAAAEYTLLAKAEPYIYQNDLIAGCQRTWCAELDPLELEVAAAADGRYGRRDFSQNFDHYAPDYRRFLEKGIPGILADIDASRKKYADDPQRVQTLNNMQKAMEGMRELAAHYAERARGLMGKEGYDPQRLTFIQKNCTQLVSGAPETFAQALQLVWLAHTCFVAEGRVAMALGRIDQYLWPFFRREIREGSLTEAAATEMLENVFMKITERTKMLGYGDDVVNICIGGSDAEGNCQVNALSYCVLEAVKNCNVPGPNLSARISPNTPDAFLNACLRVIGTGLGYPALMNDTVNKAALLRCGYDPADVSDYAMVGCIENFLPGKQPPWSDGRFDPPRFFEHVFHDGRGAHSHTMGVRTGPVETIDSMEEFMRRFEKQLAFGAADYVSAFRCGNTRLNPANYTDPFLSCFDDTCIDRGLDMHSGGCKYPSVHGAALMGVGTTADSLAAIEKVVFVDHDATLTELSEALDHNFEGYEALREKLLAAPKYGNNDPFADKYAVWFLNFLTGEFDKYRTDDGGRIYSAMAANINNIFAGRAIGATPDGRLAGEPLSDAASPTYGRDTGGATTTVLSVTKPDYTRIACGSVVNQKFSPAMFTDEKRSKLLALIKVYFQKGGQEIQINATSRKVLQDAMEHPENYPNLVVRVSGFSALYVTLDPAVQLDILRRTQQE